MLSAVAFKPTQHQSTGTHAHFSLKEVTKPPTSCVRPKYLPLAMATRIVGMWRIVGMCLILKPLRIHRGKDISWLTTLLASTATRLTSTVIRSNCCAGATAMSSTSLAGICARSRTRCVDESRSKSNTVRVAKGKKWR